MDNATVNRCFKLNIPVWYSGTVYTIEAVSVRRKERGGGEGFDTILELRRQSGRGRIFVPAVEVEEVTTP